eukprot:NODE_49_length_31687_cov_0.791123.p17 type:complete len:162 gc:universal NODE_49_length_31687_cov_0.791123:28424-28909(+)
MSFLLALDFAAKKHKTQRRKDEITPYINHPIGVCLIIEEAGINDQDIMKAAILHDVLEDTDSSYEELQTLFGDKVANLVKSVTDDTSLPSDERKAGQILKMKTASNESKIIKMADRIYNLRDMKIWDKEKQNRYKLWGRRLLEVCVGTNDKLECWLELECK